MAAGQAHPPAGSENEGLAVAPHQEVGDQRAQQIAGRRGNDHTNEGELRLCGQRAAKGNDDLARDRNAGAFRRHRQEDRQQTTRGDQLDDRMRHPRKRTS